MTQTIHIHFEIGKLIACGDEYKNRLISSAMQLRKEYNITSIWLTVRLNYGHVTDYKHINITTAIQLINDCIRDHLHKSVSEISYGISPVEIVSIEPLEFGRTIMQPQTKLDRFVKGV
jgi:hypothetical protein